MTPSPAPQSRADGQTTRAEPSGADGLRFASDLVGLMNALLAIIEQETELVRIGHLTEAADLTAAKTELSGRYLAELMRMKAHARALFRDSPAVLEQLQRRHDLFRALLQINLTVLATAHAVAEGLIRGAAGELARKSAPQAYGASGQTLGAPAGAAQPVALSKAS